MSGRIVPGMPDADYHADPSLSSTGARRILSSPARFRWEQEHRRERAAFDVGHAVHAMVLGVGMELAVIDADSWRTSAAKAARAAAHAEGKVPLLAKDVQPIRDMAAAVLAHRTARALLERPGTAEVSLFADDPETGTPLRARPDFLPDAGTGRTLVTDLKTAQSADPREFRRSVATYGYHQQNAWYLDLLSLTRGDADAAFLFVVVESEAPHLVSVCQLDADAITRGRELNRAAIDLYARCAAADEWPGYGDDVHLIDLPAWAMNGLETVL